MKKFEKLGIFYLGQEYDLVGKKRRENLLLYDSKDMVTHGVCVGMTGSGKTGLCIGLIEEAAIDGIPSILVDPKGDLANLLLTFPDLQPSDFLPWMNVEDARKKGLSEEQYAEKQAALWKNGLAEWGQDNARIKRLKDSVDFAIYTPGSSAGLPVSILRSFAAPERVIIEDTDLLRERINTTVTSLLGLLGIEADPIQSREHILLSTIFDSAWRQGQDLDLAALIQFIQSPPFSRVGVFDLESFFPSKDRFALAMAMNNLLAAPGFDTWMRGEPLDIDAMLHTSEGKPRVSIFSIAHLNDAERMFFVSLLLTQLLGWTRTQSGTTSLRALFYMDEIFGYFPPVAKPPSKEPLLTLLKQARAFGLGVLLATQNPVDLDYKGLSNTGTWFLGRLQTERDKARVLDGLEGAGSSMQGRFDRQKMEEVLAGLKKRVFLMNNVHDDAPVVFETRWVMSYLRGPLTRTQIKTLMDPRKAERAAEVPKAPEPLAAVVEKPSKRAAKRRERLVLDPSISEYFLPVRGREPEDSSLVYKPMLLGSAKVYYADAKAGVASEHVVGNLTPLPSQGLPVDWDEGKQFEMDMEELETRAEEDASFLPLSEDARKVKSYDAWRKSFKGYIFRNHKLELLKSTTLGIVSKPDESEREFRIRLQLAAHEERDRLTERLRKKYAPKIARLEDRMRRAEQKVEKEKEQAKHQKFQTAISLGATVLSAFAGRKAFGLSTLGRATTAARGAGRAAKEAADVGRAKENAEALKEQIAALEGEFNQETEELETSVDPSTADLKSMTVRPKKTNISVEMLTLLWVPLYQDASGQATPAWE